MTFNVTFSESDQTFRAEFQELNIVTGDIIKAQDKTVSPAATAQVVQPDTGYNYLSQVTVEAIPASLYADSEALQSIIDRSITSYINDRVTSIGTYAFHSCKQLSRLSLPNVTSIGEYAFAKCESLTMIDLPILTEVPKNCFDGAVKSPNTCLTFPNVQKINYMSFYACTGLSKIDFPKISYISQMSLASYNRNISALIIRTPTVCTLENTNAFNGTAIASATGYIYVPQSLVDQYKAATNWATYANQIRAIEDYPEITGGE